MDEVERNPFTLPSDEEVFKLRDEDKSAPGRQAGGNAQGVAEDDDRADDGGAQRLKELMRGRHRDDGRLRRRGRRATS